MVVHVLEEATNSDAHVSQVSPEFCAKSQRDQKDVQTTLFHSIHAEMVENVEMDQLAYTVNALITLQENSVTDRA